MKNLIVVFSFITFSNLILAQNFVNGNFETTQFSGTSPSSSTWSDCPFSNPTPYDMCCIGNYNGGCDRIPGWNYVGFHHTTVNFFYDCRLASGTGTWGSYPFDNNGVGAIGLQNYHDGTQRRTYIQGSFDAPLVAGQQYQISYSIKTTTAVGRTCDMHYMLTSSPINIPLYADKTNATYYEGNIANRYRNDPTNSANGSFIVTNAQPLLFGPGSAGSAGRYENTGWQTYSFIFTASGGEQYITIGAFKNDANSNLSNLPGGVSSSVAQYNLSFYYLDDFVITPINPLGLAVTNKQAKCMEGKNLVSWSTDPNAALPEHIVVEKSANAVDFEFLQEINQTDIVNDEITIVDFDPFSGNTFYRLRYTDQNGQEINSSITKLSCLTNTDLMLFPNPTSGEFTVSLPSNLGRNFSITLTDALGRIISYSQFDEYLSAITLKMDDKWANGTYIIKIQDDSQTFVQQIIRQ